MELDLSKLSNIGIDRIVISNFKINNFKDLQKIEILNKLSFTQQLKLNDDNYSFSYCNTTKEDGEEYDVSVLEFNPTRIFTGFNLYNSNMETLKRSIEYIKECFVKNGIELDLTEAKIKELEINITLPIDFSSLNDVIALFGKSNNKGLGIYAIVPWEDSIKKMSKLGTFYINSKRKTGKVIKIYDKSLELQIKKNLFLPEKLTRVEVLFGRDYFREIMLKKGLDNSLDSFLNLKDTDIEVFFKEALKKELVINVKKSLKQIENKIKYQFNNFRKNERIKRTERKRLISLGKDVPSYLKEERGVFKYLVENSWVFDFSYLIKLCELVESKNKKSYFNQLKKYSNINNLEIYNDFISRIFNSAN